MKDVLSGFSAYRYYRVPPRYLALCPALPSPEGDRCRSALSRNPFARDVLGFPLQVLVTSRNERTCSRIMSQQLFSCELPFGSIGETLHGFDVASPALTLFSLSRMIPFNRLVMAMYEMCGKFTFFCPTRELAAALREQRWFTEAGGSSADATVSVGDGGERPSFDDGWRQVFSADGKALSMWMREPLVTVGELRSFAGAVAGMRGSRVFREAVECVSGIAFSPFEAQLSMLLGMPRLRGGMGYDRFENNRVVVLSEAARTLSGLRRAVVDLRLLSPDGEREWLIECQGKVIHDRQAAGSRDAARVTALQAMGMNVTLLSHDQISDSAKFRELLGMLYRELGMPLAEKTLREERAEMQLRADIFSPWEDLPGLEGGQR